jgi:hypothetical protein
VVPSNGEYYETIHVYLDESSPHVFETDDILESIRNLFNMSDAEETNIRVVPPESWYCEIICLSPDEISPHGFQAGEILDATSDPSAIHFVLPLDQIFSLVNEWDPSIGRAEFQKLLDEVESFVPIPWHP